MAVSYLSQQPFVSSEPIPSIDLNLMASVLQQKQSMFDANFEKAQSQLSTISSLDMLRDDDKQYRDSKLNELTKNLNKMNGDFSDPNISSQIDNSISSIYSDSRILNAVSSTKSIRALQEGYKKMQSNPKMAKYYSDANYDADMAEVERYMSSTDPNDTYRGKSAPTTFASYMPDLIKAAERLKPDGYERLEDGTGGFYNTVSGTFVSQERIANNIMNVLDSNQKAQLARDANYLWGKKLNLQPPELVNKLTNTIDSRIADMNAAIKSLEGVKGTYGPDDAKKTQARIDAYKKEVKELGTKKLKVENDYNNYLKNGGSLEGLRFMAYEYDISKTLGNLYSWNKEGTKRNVDPYELEKVRSLNRQTELILAGQIRKDIALLTNKKDKPEPTTLPVLTSDKSDNAVSERMQFRNSQADIFEAGAVQLYTENPNIKINKQILTGMGKGRYVGVDNLPAKTDEAVIQHNILSFAAQRNRIAANRDEETYKQYDSLGIDEDSIDKRTLNSVKANLVSTNPSFANLGVDDFKIVNIHQSDKQFKMGADKQLQEDDDFYADVEIKQNGKWVRLSTPVPLSQNIVDIYSGGVLKKQSKEQKILNSFVDERNQFSTPIQSEKNPNVVGNISVIKLKDGTFEAFIEYDGVPIPISKLSESKLPLYYAWDAFRLGRDFVRNLSSRDQLKQYVKKYVPNANLNTNNIKFGNHNIYKITPKPVASANNPINVSSTQSGSSLFSDQ